MTVKHLLYGVVILFLMSIIPATSAAQEQELLDRVKAWQEAFNAGDLEAVMAMFAPGFEFEMVGMGTLTDRAMIEGLHAYAIGLKSQMRSPTCTVEGNTVNCKTYETSEFHRIAGIPDTLYTSDIYVFNEEGLIEKISATKSPESVQAEGEILGTFIPWLAENRPDEYARLFTPDGVFIYSGENAPVVLNTLQEWKDSSLAGSAAEEESPAESPVENPAKSPAESPATSPTPSGVGLNWPLILGIVVGGLLLLALGAGVWRTFLRAA